VSTIYSHSRLASFENCRKQFQFRYVLGIPAESEGIEAFVGKRVHEVLERLYVFADQGRVPALEKVLARYHAIWDEHFDPERVRIVRSGTDAAFYRELGVRCLSNYYRRHYPFDGSETLGLEERVLFDLDEAGRYRMQGIIDRISRTPDGVIEIHDYKTGRYVPSQKKLDEDRQLALYQIGLAESYGERQPIRLVWHYVARGELRTSTRTSEQLGRLREQTIDLIERIGAETEFAPSKIPLCDWCEYRSICPAWGNQPPAVAARRPRRAKPGSTPAAADAKQLRLL